MSCFRPLVAWWYSPEYQDSRPGGLDRPIILCTYQGTKYDYSVPLRVPFLARPCLRQYLLPCGKCPGCLLDRKAQWTFRALCELDEHHDSCFLTLTVNDDFSERIFPGGKLQHTYWQLFMKRLRRRFNSPVRYLMCGEYGTNTLRPHYHAILYGFFPPDYNLVYSGDSYDVFRSSFIDGLWSDPDTGDSYGFHSVAPATEETIRYITGYVLKKSVGGTNGFDGSYLRCSCRPSLGKAFFMKYYKQLYASDSSLDFPNNFVILSGNRIRVPRYFDKLFKDLSDNVDYVSLLEFRARQMALRPPLEKSDLLRKEDYVIQVCKASHNRRAMEV